MFGKLFQKSKVQGAKVDTVIENPKLGVGQSLHGTVHVTGGSVGQEVRSIVVELVSRCIIEMHGSEKVYADVVLTQAAFEAGWIEPGADAFVEFDMEIPADAPISVGSTQVFLRTHLDIEDAPGIQDHDPITLLPTETMAAVLNGVLDAGFELVDTEVEHQPHRWPSFVQEFDFKPRSFSDYEIEEVEISMAANEAGVDVTLTVDRRGGFFSSGSERVARFRVNDVDAAALDMARELRQAIASLT